MVHESSVCLSLTRFFGRGSTEGTNCLKILCLVFVFVFFVLCEFVLGLILLICENLRFDDLCAEWLGDRLKFVLGPNIIICG